MPVLLNLFGVFLLYHSRNKSGCLIRAELVGKGEGKLVQWSFTSSYLYSMYIRQQTTLIYYQFTAWPFELATFC